MPKCEFLDNKGTFKLTNADTYSDLYFPIANEAGLKSVVTPNLAGDSKLDQNHFLLEPVSVEGLHNNKNSRNFWILTEGNKPWSVTGNSVWQQADGVEHTEVTAGPMWHTIQRTSKDEKIKVAVTSFVPVYKNTEVHVVEIENISDKAFEMQFVASIPLYGRSADNIRDHRHVTSLLHRTKTVKNGVHVRPTLSFDERGHQLNDTTYFVEGITGNGDSPVSFIPEVFPFIMEGGTFERPGALLNKFPVCGVEAGYECEGQEALGGLIFEKALINPNEKLVYITFAGASQDISEEKAESVISDMLSDLTDIDKVNASLSEVKEYWNKKINVAYHTGDSDFDGFMTWVSFQPELRRVYGCSFLPHHDYGRGGRGWRDLWQDCLALLLMNPDGVREMLVSNFEGVRTDGTNATIIGSKLGEFKADRNGITRVWMDHGMWPLLTTALYIDQTGDIDLLFEEVPYYKDKQVLRGTGIDTEWDQVSLREKTDAGDIYKGTILEHLLLESLAEFWEVGEHNNIRLRDADWNDAVDMAGEKGESVAFTHAFAGNLDTLANLLDKLSTKQETVSIMSEMNKLLTEGDALYKDVAGKLNVLSEYVDSVKHNVTGDKCDVKISDLSANLRAKSESIKAHLRENEWITDKEGNSHFNGYYDNDGNPLEGDNKVGPQMTLTGQVFAIMCGTATDEQVTAITKSADALLFDKDCGGYRLNTNFKEVKTNVGRMFGFAFGEKENGAVFSHMAVMYGNALYKRGFAKEGFKVLNSLYTQSIDFERGHIYPGIPEYFGRGGRGLYHYLTGAASWFMMTVVNQMFGVRGEYGDLTMDPKLLKEQFDKNGKASISFTFEGKNFEVTYDNSLYLEYGEYKNGSITLDGENVASISKDTIAKLDNSLHKIIVRLERK